MTEFKINLVLWLLQVCIFFYLLWEAITMIKLYFTPPQAQALGYLFFAWMAGTMAYYDINK